MQVLVRYGVTIQVISVVVNTSPLQKGFSVVYDASINEPHNSSCIIKFTQPNIPAKSSEHNSVTDQNYLPKVQKQTWQKTKKWIISWLNFKCVWDRRSKHNYFACTIYYLCLPLSMLHLLLPLDGQYIYFLCSISLFTIVSVIPLHISRLFTLE